MIRKSYGTWHKVLTCEKCYCPVLQDNIIKFEGICQHCGHEQQNGPITKIRRRITHYETNAFLRPFRLLSLSDRDYWEYLE